jgi:hypothetical protein
LVRYGRRKFGIVVSLLVTTLLTFPLMNNLSNPNEHVEVIAVLFAILLFVSMGDISLDAASCKELENPVLSSFIQMFYQSLGNIAGGLLLMKFARPADWYFFETNRPICSAESFTLAVGLLNGVVGLLLHFFYCERVLPEEEEEETPSFGRIFKFYLHFLRPKYKMCRFGVYLLLFGQGIKFFEVGFQPEAIYRGFPKELVPELGTICIFAGLGANMVVSRFLSRANVWTMVRVVYSIQLVFYALVFLSGSFSQPVVIAASIVMQMLHLVSFMLNASEVNTFGECSLAGVSITTLASLMNFGNNHWIQLKVIHLVGYHKAVGFGLVLAAAIGIGAGRVFRWIEAGQPEGHLVTAEDRKKD